MQRGIDRGERRHIDDGVPAGRLPDARPDVEVGEVARRGERVLRNDAEHAAHHHAVEAVAGVEQLEHDAHQHDHGDEVRQRRDRLGDAAVALALDAVEQQRHEDGQREAEHDAVDGQAQRVLERGAEVIALHELFKIGQPDPLAAPDTQARRVLAERNLQPRHGHIGEDDDVNHRQNEEQVHLPVPLEVPPERPERREISFHG